MPKLLTEICTEEFFSRLAEAVGGTAGNFIDSNKTILPLHIIVNYSGLKSLDGFDNLNNDYIAIYIGARFKESMQKVFDALTTEYDPLANYKMETEETHSGTDSNTRGGSDTSSSTSPSITKHFATTFDDQANEREVGKTEHTYAGSVSYGRTDTLSHGHKVVTNKEGNNGVRTIQEIIESELDLRLRRNFFEFIITCVVIALSCGVWDGDEE